MKIWYEKSRIYNFNTLCLGVLIILSPVQQSIANQTNSANVHTNHWANWVLSQVKSLPSIKAQDAEILKSKALHSVQSQPLYNPELSLSYTERDDREFGVGLTQTLDWHNKRLENSKLGQVTYDLSLINKKIETEDKLAQALYAFIEYAKEKQLLEISKQQEQLLEQFSDDLKIREELGDVGNMDAEMTYLSLTQNLQQISLAEVRYRQTLSVLEETLDSQSIPYEPNVSIWKDNVPKEEISQFVDAAFKTQLSQKLLEQSQYESKVSKLESKNNPTFGVGLARDGDENTISFEFSIPLNIHNKYTAQYQASLQQVSKSELELSEQKRVLNKKVKQALNNYQELKKRVEKWEKLTTQRVKGSKKILTKLWKSGDITTSDYLFALQQRTDSLISNVELTSQMQNSWIDWLVSTSQVESWLKQLLNH